VGRIFGAQRHQARFVHLTAVVGWT